MRLTSLDLIRGVAALFVVVYHFQHLAAFGQDPHSWAVTLATLPFYSVLKPIYTLGWMSVDLFFVISGFVFAWIYQKAISEKGISLYEFMVLRLTRLYPLHILTLLTVIVLQGLYLQRIGMFFLMPYNDVYHFVLNVGFLQGWGLERGASFNGPSWSISVEMVLYLLFFATCRLIPAWPRSTALVLVCFGLLLQIVLPLIGRGVTGYFLGVLAYHAFARCIDRADAASTARWSSKALCAIWVAVLILYYTDAVDRLCVGLGVPQHAFLAGKLGTRLVICALFPATVFVFALSEVSLGLRWRAGALLGDLSYSSYMIHFPLQLIFANLVAYEYLTAADIRSATSLGCFFVLLIPLSWVAHRYVEMPMQRAGRKLILDRRSVKPIQITPNITSVR